MDHWEAEVFVLRADSRVALSERARELSAWLDHRHDVVLKDLAFTLNRDLPSGGSRLAVVAGSTTELHGRLSRAVERLADPECRQIKDSQGIYYFEEPLHPQGRLAFLFPGEGAQYLNMLADLFPHFPEVAEHFSLYDRMSMDQGRDQPISRSIILPPDASREAQEQAERQLWRLGNAISSVLIADWCIFKLLSNLGLRPDATAGHSAGEFSAIVAAGCIDHDEWLVQKLLECGQQLQPQEDEGNLPESVLLAVGAGRALAREVIRELRADAYVAMDNCPHQCVIVGPPGPMAGVESAFRSRGVVCERLPFRRPYHTPLFEPLLGPVRKMYDALTVRVPRTPVYSCVTTRPFPSDPAEIRRLAVSHWASTVEFTDLVEQLYADGVRILVESGPRGNLTAFVEDILRGRSFVAAPANLPRRSGVVQINHLVGLLAAHHVPVHFDHLYVRRQPRLIEWTGGGPSGNGERTSATPASARAVTPPQPVASSAASVSARPTAALIAAVPAPPAGASKKSAAVLAHYWSVMEQFLEVEREMMERYLTGRRPPTPATPTKAPKPRRLPMLGQVVEHVPGKELVVRRQVDLNEDLYGLDHTLGGRHGSTLDPNQHGLPFMPMAFSMEMMAEVASLLVPGKLVIGLRRVRLQRWIPFDDEPVTLEVKATLNPDKPAQVAMSIRDFGNAVRPGNPESPAVTATVLLGDRYPEPPPVEPWAFANARQCPLTPDDLYEGERRLFHGPLFQAVCATGRLADDAVEGELVTLPHSGLFRSAPDADLLLDPLLIDASTHVLGLWHLAQPDRVGRVVLPYEMGAVDFHGPKPAVGTRLGCRIRIDRISPRQVSHRIELIGPDGRYWCRLIPAEYWRFYWPVEYVDYFRHKDRFLLGRECKQMVPLKAPVPFSLMRVDAPEDLRQTVHRTGLAHVSLAPREWQAFRAMQSPNSRIDDWLFGRLAARDALRSLWAQQTGERLFPADIEIDTDEHGKPTARRRDGRDVPLPAVSIAHSDGICLGLAAQAPSVGIDLETIEPRGPGFEQISFDDAERRLLDTFDNRDEAIARFWCAKEAVAKALGRGLVEGPRSVVVRRYDAATGTAEAALGPLLAAEFPQLRLDLLVVYTYRDENLIVAVTFMEKGQP